MTQVRILRKAFRPVTDRGVGKVGANQELEESHKSPDLVAVGGWGKGQGANMKQTGVAKKMFKHEPEG